MDSAITHLKYGTSVVLDSTNYTTLRCLQEAASRLLPHLFDACLNYAVRPPEWKTANCVVIPKQGNLQPPQIVPAHLPPAMFRQAARVSRGQTTRPRERGHEFIPDEHNPTIRLSTPCSAPSHQSQLPLALVKAQTKQQATPCDPLY